jgi:predicted ATPase
LFIMGDFAESNRYLEEGIALYRAQGEQSDIAIYGFDNGICCLFYHAWLLWLRGYPDQALAQILTTRQAAERSGYPFDLIPALVFECYIYLYRGNFAAAAQTAVNMIDLARRHNVASWPAYGAIQRGAALVELGQREQGIALMQEGIAGMRADNVEMTQPLFLTLLANAYLQQGDVTRGLQAVEEALERVAATDERHWEAETLRIRGELWLKRPGHADANRQAAEVAFQQGLTIARRQQARSLELRMAMSLSRLWMAQDQRQAAHKLLEPVYGWFTEGFSTVDLQKARRLLDELG